MRRKTFDALVSAGGARPGGGAACRGRTADFGDYSFANGQVSSQLSAQKIVFPTKSNAEFKALPASDQAAMGPVRGPADDHRRAGQDLRRPLHRRPPAKWARARPTRSCPPRRWPRPRTSRWRAWCRPCSAAPPSARCCSRPTASGVRPDRTVRRDRVLHRRRPAAHPLGDRPGARAPGAGREGSAGQVRPRHHRHRVSGLGPCGRPGSTSRPAALSVTRCIYRFPGCASGASQAGLNYFLTTRGTKVPTAHDRDPC